MSTIVCVTCGLFFTANSNKMCCKLQSFSATKQVISNLNSLPFKIDNNINHVETNYNPSDDEGDVGGIVEEYDFDSE